MQQIFVILFSIHERPQTFFRGGQKFSRGGGQKPTFCLKINIKHTIFLKKVQKTLFLAGLGRPWGTRAPLTPSGRPWFQYYKLYKRQKRRCIGLWLKHWSLKFGLHKIWEDSLRKAKPLNAITFQNHIFTKNCLNHLLMLSFG